ncbi:hypothetical protein GYMLUDRAFT_240881 [Collybiopsis luxurians FD-317 M1]|nr:hypothetical protein GYMLUDRAFT_240881 [Collybiopsis luxurians FD-317 M1]
MLEGTSNFQLFCKNCRFKLDKLATKGSDIEDVEYDEFIRRNRSNNIPATAEERSYMQSLTDEASLNLEHYDYAILELELELIRLKQRRNDTLQKRVGPRKSLLSPIRTLPAEILLQILAEAGGPITLKYPTNPRKLQSPTFGLSWICSWWRRLVLSEGRMWSSLEINYGRLPADISPELFAFMQECFLERGGNASRQIVLEDTNPRYDEDFESLIVDVIFKVAPLWSDISFSFVRDSPMMKYLIEGLHNVTPTGFPFLENLYLDVHKDSETEIYHGFQNCPQLRSLETVVLRRTDSIHIHNLTWLKIDLYTGVSLAEVLAQCPTLETLVVEHFTLESGYDHVPVQVYHHPRLSHLDVSLTNGDPDSYIYTWMWKGVHLPALTHLKFHFWMDDPEALRALALMLNRSCCALREMFAEEYLHGVDEEQWGQFLDEISSVIRADTSISHN